MVSESKTGNMSLPSDNIDPARLYERDFDAHTSTVAETKEAVRDATLAMLDVWFESVSNGNKILLFGNGGSASSAQHIAAELVVRLRKGRHPIPAIALTADTSIITACANDLGFNRIFARQIEALGQSGDIAVGLSTSGQSDNIIAALEVSRQMGVVPTALVGSESTAIQGLSSVTIVVPSTDPARIQEMHLVIAHFLCHALEQTLELV